MQQDLGLAQAGRHVECELYAHLKTWVNVVDYRLHEACRMPTPIVFLQLLSGHLEKVRRCADIPDCHRHDDVDTSGASLAERGGGADFIDDERELSVDDFLPHHGGRGGGVENAARCQEQYDWHDEQRGEPSPATEEHAAKRI